MANSTHASYTKVGLTILLAVIAIVATLIYLGGIRDESDEFLVETYYDKCVSGLSVGSAVNFRGVQIGEVKEIGFVFTRYDGVPNKDKMRIYVLMALSRKLLGGTPDSSFQFDKVIANGLRAQVSSSGITGLSRIELDLFPAESVNPIREISWTPKVVYIPPQISLLDSFSDSATKVMNQINKMDIESAWSNINLSVESAAHAASALKTLVEANQADLERVIENMSETMVSVRELAEQLKRNPSLLIRERTLEPLEETER